MPEGPHGRELAALMVDVAAVIKAISAAVGKGPLLGLAAQADSTPHPAAGVLPTPQAWTPPGAKTPYPYGAHGAQGHGDEQNGTRGKLIVGCVVVSLLLCVALGWASVLAVSMF